MKSILDDLNAQGDIKIQYSAGRSGWQNNSYRKANRSSTKFIKRQQKVCAYCKAINRTPYTGHDVKSCWIIPKDDKLDLIKAFSVLTVDFDCDEVSRFTKK